MTKFRFLHISDLHWSTESVAEISFMRDALISQLISAPAQPSEPISFIIFSGDLVLAGEKPDLFEKSYLQFLKPIADALSIPEDKIYIAPGNHDISRSDVRTSPVIESGMQTQISSIDSANRFIDDAKKGELQNLLGVSRTDNFTSFVQKIRGDQFRGDAFCQSYKIKFQDKLLGIGILNSTWRATGEADDVDFEKLWVGERVIDEVIGELAGVDFKIAVLHHPTNWLHHVEQQSSAKRLQREFDLVCFGHLHNSHPKQIIDLDGQAAWSQAPSLHGGRSATNGFHIIEYDFYDQKLNVETFEYQGDSTTSSKLFKRSKSGTNGRIVMDLYNEEKRTRSDKVNLVLRDRRDRFRVRAAEHLDFTRIATEADQQNFSELITPPLSRPNKDSASNNSANDKVDIDIDSLIDEAKNSIFLAERHMGKTSLLYQIGSKVSNGQGVTRYIPVFVDARATKIAKYELERCFTGIFSPVPKSIEFTKCLEEGVFLFLIDNVDSEDEEKLDQIANCVKKYDKNKWMLFGDYEKSSVVKDRIYREKFADFDIIDINFLNRKMIRKLSSQWSSKYSVDQDSHFDSVINQIDRDGLPKTAYIVSLLSWSILENSKKEKINESSLLSNVIDHLLDKANFRSRLGTFDPSAKRIVLQHLAHYMKTNNAFILRNDVLKWLVDFFDDRGLPFDADDALIKLVNCGILHYDGSYIYFKYRCFQEYMVAEYMDKRREYIEGLFDNLGYLDYSRELELLSGLNKEIDWLIERLFKMLEERSPVEIAGVTSAGISAVFDESLNPGTSQSDIDRIRKKRLTKEQVDDLLDEVDRKTTAKKGKSAKEIWHESGKDISSIKSIVDDEALELDRAKTIEPLSLPTFIASINLLGKIVKFSDFSNIDTKSKSVSLVLNNWMKINVMLINTLNEVLESSLKKDEFMSTPDIERLKYFFKKIFFRGTSSIIIDVLGSPTLSGTLTKVFEKDRITTAERIFILQIMEDIDDPCWSKNWSALILDKQISGFLFDSLIDRLRTITHSKALSDRKYGDVCSVLDTIEQRLDWTTSRKDLEIRDVRDSANLARFKEIDR